MECTAHINALRFGSFQSTEPAEKNSCQENENLRPCNAAVTDGRSPLWKEIRLPVADVLEGLVEGDDPASVLLAIGFSFVF